MVLYGLAWCCVVMVWEGIAWDKLWCDLVLNGMI
jgi:hypothetical protein